MAAVASAADPDRDFSGKWTLDQSASRLQNLDVPAAPEFSIVQQDAAIHLSTNASYSLTGGETKYRIGGETHSTAVKWEGAALLVNTLVTGPHDYTVMDRWKLSRDHSTLTITRQVMHGTQQSEGVLVYRAAGWTPAPMAQPQTQVAQTQVAQTQLPQTQVATETPRPLTIRRQTPPPSRTPQAEYIVPAGTHLALALRNTVDTKHSREGDRIYLETVFPVAANGWIVIPRGSFVNGTVTMSKPAGQKSKGEMYIRFDSLILPNGTTRDFHSRLTSAEGSKVDRDEGKVSGERDTARDVGTVAATTGAGAGLGGVVGASSGHALGGVGVGAAAGAAAGLAAIFLKKGPEAILRQGTTVEMVLDRDISFTPADLGR
jgi:hypothetical protein